MTNTVNELLSRLEGVKGAGQNRWLARCPAHDDRTPSLSVSCTPEDKILLHCFAGCDYRAVLESLGLRPSDLFATDVLARRGRRNTNRVHRVRIEAKEAKDFSSLDMEFRDAITPEQVSQLSTSLGVLAESLRRLGVGWASREALAEHGTGCKGHGAYAFPMQADGTVVGFRLRGPDGGKFAVSGSKQGLFIPSDITGDGPLFICEGPTDCAALLDLGINAIGRPFCRGGTKLIIEFVRRDRRSDIIILADADGPGLSGARALADRLTIHCKNVRVLVPPNGCNDARDWRRAGATREEVMAAADQAERFWVVVTNSRKRGASHV